MRHMWRQSIWLFIILILVFVPEQFLAQENTETPTIPPTATLEVTDTATSTATLSPTETASPTAVPETVEPPTTIPETPTASLAETIVTAETTDILEVTAETSTQETAIPTDIPIVTVEATVEAELVEETAEVTAYPEATETLIEVTEFATPAPETTPDTGIRSLDTAPVITLDTPQAGSPPDESCPIDLVIMVDQSSSVDSGEFEQQRTFVMTLLNEMAIRDLNAEAKVGVGFFSSAVFTNVDFPLTSDKTALIGNVDNYSRNFGFTQQGVAIQMAQAEFLANGRSNHANVIMILTDGDPFDSVPIVNVADASEKAQLDGTTLYAVGVTGEDFNPQFPVLTQSTLEDIAGDREGTNPPIPDEDLIFEITFDTMDNPAFINQIATAICDEPVPPDTCTVPGQFAQTQGFVAFNDNEDGEIDCEITGLHAEYFTGFQVIDGNISRTTYGGAVQHTYDETIDFSTQTDWKLEEGMQAQFSVRWTGYLIPQEDEPEPEVTPEVTPTGTLTPSPTPSPTLTPTPTGIPTGVNLAISFAGIDSATDGIRVWVKIGEPQQWVLAIDTWSQPYLHYQINDVFYGQEIPIWIEYYHYDTSSSPIIPNLQFQYNLNNDAEPNPQPVPSNWLIPVDPQGLVDYDNAYTMDAPAAQTFNQMASCTNDQVTLVPVYPGRSNEAEDMLAIANESGVIVHDAPLWNASQIDTFEWGSTHPVEVYWNLPNNELWYRIEQTYPFTELDDSVGSNEAWIAFKVPDAGGSETFYYVIGMGQTAQPCSNHGEILATEDITFVYNRREAARYAFWHSYANNPVSSITIRVTNNRDFIDAPYANFAYQDLTQGTGSADFVSETIWAGGLPMTRGLSNSCPNVPSSHSPPGFGWLVCFFGNSANFATSPTWDAHPYISAYFTNNFVPKPEPPDGGYNNTILDVIERGEQIRFTNTNFVNALDATDVNAYMVISDGTIHDAVVGEFGSFIRRTLGELLQGDYMWINSYDENTDDGDYHGLVVVGWYEIRDCENVMVYEGEHPSDFGFDDLLPSVPDNGNYVPYVADFTGTQQPVPRPFYCTRYRQETIRPEFIGNVQPHFWYFYKILNRSSDGTSAVRLSPSEIFVQPNMWSWE